MTAGERLRPAALPALFALGAALGTAWDQMHVRGGVEIYRDPAFAGQSWWVPAEFGLAYAAGAAAIAVLGRPAPDGGSPRRFMTETLWLSAVYALTALAPERPAALTAAVAALALARAPAIAALVRRNPLPAALLVAGGPAIEAVLSGAGLFSYTRPQLLGIPAWLPLLYLHAVPFAVRLTETALRWFGAPAPARPLSARGP